MDGPAITSGRNGWTIQPGRRPDGEGGGHLAAGTGRADGGQDAAQRTGRPGPGVTSYYRTSGAGAFRLADAQREIGALFLQGQGWGLGGSVDITAIDAWNVTGRYGWVGGTGTSAHIVPATGTIIIVLAQVGADSPVTPGWMRDFLTYAATHF